MLCEWHRDACGMALVSVVFLGMLFTIMALAVFALAGHEYGQATRRDDSGSAFWLAEAAIEHAKAEIFKDMEWSAGFDSVELSGGDEGYYSLTVQDTTYNGEAATRMLARGFIRRPGASYVERDVEIYAKIGPAALLYAIFSMNCIDAGGNVDVCGLVHGNDCVINDGSAFDAPDSCFYDTVLSDSFVVVPPAIRTEPWFYPNTSYYYVLGKPSGTDYVYIAIPDSSGTLRLRDNNGIQVSLVDSVATDNGGNALVRYQGGNIEWKFSNTTRIEEFFNQSTGRCSLRTGDQDVIVNFGEYLFGAAATKTDIHISDNVDYDAPIVSTVFNTRYMGPDFVTENLVDSIYWQGGNMDLQTAMFIPTNGLALVVHTVDTPGNANIYVGTTDSPALFYVTGSINRFNAIGALYGSTIVLGNITDMAGTPGFWFNPAFIDNLPDYLEIQFGASGFAEILFWREIPPLYS
jgi:hypothetical protein